MKWLAVLMLLGASPALAGTLYIDTGGLATNSGSTDSPTPQVSLATVTVSGTFIQFPGGTDLSGVVTSGDTQSSVYVQGATNSNQQIFWISAVDDTLDIATVTVSITGVTKSSATIGGQHLLTSARIEGALRAGDTAIFNNTPASSANSLWTFRNSGDTTSGFAKIRGKTGVRPVLTKTTNGDVITGNSQSGVWIENFELVAQGASGYCVSGTLGANTVIYNNKCTDSGSGGILTGSAAGVKIIGNEISGSAGSAIDMNTSASAVVFGNYIHDCGLTGIITSNSTPNSVYAYNIIDTMTGLGIDTAGSPTTRNHFLLILGNTIYKSSASGIRIQDIDQNVTLLNNLLLDNGDTGSEYNMDSLGGSFQFVGFGAYNLFNQGGGLGGTNLNNYTAHSTDLTSAPLLTDPANADFTLQATSPAKGAGYPGVFLGGSTGYMDMGAVQRQESSSGGGVKAIFITE